MNDSRRRSETGDVYTPDLHSIVIATSGKAELAWVEGDGPHSVKVTSEIR